MAEDAPCHAQRGVCLNNAAAFFSPAQAPLPTVCASATRGLCGGPDGRRCCLPQGDAADAECEKHGGVCAWTKSAGEDMNCDGTILSGMCGGPADRK